MGILPPPPPLLCKPLTRRFRPPPHFRARWRMAYPMATLEVEGWKKA